MTKEDVKMMSNSELICNLLIKRDNLITIRRNLHDNEFIDNSRIKRELEELFDIEEQDYTTCLTEVYRRMQ